MNVSRSTVTCDLDIISAELEVTTTCLRRDKVCKLNKKHYIRNIPRRRAILGYTDIPGYNLQAIVRWMAAECAKP